MARKTAPGSTKGAPPPGEDQDRQCECLWRRRAVQEPGHPHGCSQRPSAPYAVAGKTLYLCRECAVVADCFRAQHAKHGIEFAQAPTENQAAADAGD